MSKQYITLKDIAKALNLSASTVSRAMKNNPAISAETRELVQNFARKHKYKPNILAMQLRTKRNTTIGVIVPEIVHYFFSTVLAGIQAEAEKENYNILICQSNEDYKKEIKCVQTLLDARVSGILASQSKTTKEYDHFQEIVDNNVQLVFFDRICTGINTDKVVVDDYEGALKAVDYLASTGCKRIAFLGSDSDLPISNNRRMGYESALRKHKIKVIKSLIKECDTRELAQKIIPDMLNESNTPDAFFCINDEVAAYCLQAVKAVGFRVPEDISICGFTNGYLTEVTEPTLTSVDQHGFEMGITAARLLIDRIEGKETKKGVVSKLIKTELVLRNSTR
ncbi:MAG: LacI family DNA-binding transcriptional regulator [Dysgonamonadaceae bacterium]|jgi:LacI family transcriptional regulator|nr:LacI family DNA-binding transcriptional regulator [Dysgonamonadaceae bacterium]MDD3356061.1 LacI family DNA-binding transcriptional regulator [Dysgonamonadaceae bacterium]MDD3726925.1 LacI family DNA-binding transcriptional regulator [Dysgonamonadaceae bacterium]MDD4247252.1 LacI family DNA-binding transcriptional regulator [Dysgonamonadaceae bacterium]MDD4605651.1 LacI family DNA-binding transcriptional regulator [Dysgonamonadaceae bacterium]